MFGIIFIIFRSALSPQNSHKSLCHSMLSPNQAFQICPQTANVQAIVYTKSHLIQSNPMYRPHNMLLPQSFSYQNAPQPYLQQCCRCQVFPHTSVSPQVSSSYHVKGDGGNNISKIVTLSPTIATSGRTLKCGGSLVPANTFLR